MRILTNPRILNEEYYGTNNELKKAEIALEKLKVKINKVGNKLDIKTTEEYAVLKSALCKVFGFSDILLQAGLSYDFGIYTIPLYSSPLYGFRDDSKFITKNEYGICYKKEADVVIHLSVDCSVLREDTCNLTAKEFLAIILHEIGHNFFNMEKKTATVLLFMNIREMLVTIIASIGNPESYSKVVGSIFGRLFISKTTYRALSKFENWWLDSLKDWSMRGAFVSLKQAIQYAANETLGVLLVIVGLLLLPVIYVLAIPGVAVMSLFNLVTFGWMDTLYVGYDNEKFSDNFATTYGYGPDLSSALIKLASYTAKGRSKTLKEYVEKDPSGTRQFVMNLYALPLAMMSHALLDCHPTTEQRILNQTKLLKTELRKQDLSAATKKKILADINKMEDIENHYFNAMPGDNPFQIWRKEGSKKKMTYGGDIREVIRGESDEIDAKEWKQFEIAAINANKKK